MKKVIVLSFDIPAGKASLRVKIWRMLKQMEAKQELGSHWILPFNQKNLAEMRSLAKLILSSGGSVKLIVGEEIV